MSKQPKIDLAKNFNYDIVSRDGVAVSPFPEYPGTIDLPHFTLPVFKKWRQALADYSKLTPEIVFFSEVFTEDDAGAVEIAETEPTADQSSIRWVNLNDALILFDIAKKIDLSGLEDGWRNDPFNNLPYLVVAWCAIVINEWANRQITFRRHIPH